MTLKPADFRYLSQSFWTEATASSGLAPGGRASMSSPTPKMGRSPVALTGEDEAAEDAGAAGAASPSARAHPGAAMRISTSAASAGDLVPTFMIDSLQK
ncbi:MAG: hypothetical protein E6K75_05985 [Candidatus Eisenbacteria bacterium]|uniref:Uncharacterized protein n=1 Tax=Eiseniibacteriota bacterium TaxID=2212470 RepID=A0A538T2X2_UNCEI|nr:MAG: hypothetical protein E6K75_05985 [Candidatus Eisenbacteria bacterium]